LPNTGVRGAGRHMPGGGEAAEMVKPHDIDVRQRRPETVEAPAIIATPKRIPIVNRDVYSWPFALK
jgi:hypothetical protein